MAYTKTVWKDRIVATPTKYKDQANVEYTFTPVPGEITEAGTPVNAVNLNKMEDALEALAAMQDIIVDRRRLASHTLYKINTAEVVSGEKIAGIELKFVQSFEQTLVYTTEAVDGYCYIFAPNGRGNITLSLNKAYADLVGNTAVFGAIPGVPYQEIPSIIELVSGDITIDTSGTYYFSPATSVINAFLVGGGASGGGGRSSSTTAAAGGGGGGGYRTIANGISVNASTAYTVTIGAGGAAPASMASGNGGGTTTAFGFSASGGSPGIYLNASPGGAGGAGGSGGGGGSYISSSGSRLGGLGGSNGATGGTSASGALGGTGSGVAMGAFGSTAEPWYGAGGGGGTVNTSTDAVRAGGTTGGGAGNVSAGSAGSFYGAGGGGGGAFINGTMYAGGAGYKGCVLVRRVS